MRALRVRIVPFLAAAAVFALPGCQEDSDRKPTTISAADGGTASWNGFTIDVPAGASSADWTVRFRGAAHPASATVSFLDVGNAVEILPSPAVVLSSPASFEMTVDPGMLASDVPELGGAHVVVLVSDSEGVLTAVLPDSIDTDTGVVTFRTTILGTYGVADHTDPLTTVAFDDPTSSIAEDAGLLDVTVEVRTLDAVRLGFDLAATAEITGGTADPETDLDVDEIEVVFENGTGDGALALLELTLVDDDVIEPDETVEITLTGEALLIGVGAQSDHTATILTDESGELSFDLAESSGQESDVYSIDVVLTTSPTTHVLSGDVTVDVSAAGTAGEGGDYSLDDTTITFPAGSGNGTVMSVGVTGAADSLVEGSETVELSLANPTGDLTLGAQAAHQLTLLDDDEALFSFEASGSPTAGEGVALSVAVELTIPGGGTLSVPFSVDVADAGGGSAVAGSDYTAFPVTQLTFPAGSASGATQSVTFTPISGDNLVEGDETAILGLQDPIGGTLQAPLTHTVTIVDDDAASVSFQVANSTTFNETTALPVDVVLSTVPSGATLAVPVSVTAVDAGGGSATPLSDYTAPSPSLVTFAAGSGNGATQAVAVQPVPDALVEGTETVNLAVTTPSGPVSITGIAAHILSIQDDNTATVAFQAASSQTLDEVTPLGVAAVLTVAGGATLAVPLSVDAVDAGGGSATSGSDYTAFGTQTLTFPVGAGTGATQSAVLTPLDDSDLKSDETVNLALQNPAAPLGLGAQTTHEVTITEGVSAQVAFASPTSGSADESTAHLIDVKLSVPGGGTLGTTVTVDVVDTGSGSASGADFTAFGVQTVTFGLGSVDGATQSVTLQPLDDVNVELDETVQLQLVNPTGPAIIGAQSTHDASITEDDQAFVEFVQRSSSTADETTSLPIDVVLSIPGGGQLDVALTADAVDGGTGTAQSGVDYATFGIQSVNFPVGSGNGATDQVTLSPNADLDVEGDELVELLLQNRGGPATASVGAQGTHQVTLLDDDSATVAFQSASSLTASESAPLDIVLELSVAGGGSLATAVTAEVVDALSGGASSGDDYTSFGTQVVTFPIGSIDGTTETVTLSPQNDSLIEGDETVELAIQGVGGPATLGGQTAHVATITDDEAQATLGFVAANSATADESSRHSITVVLTSSGALGQPLSVDVIDAGGGTATSGSDFTALGTQTLTFPAGATSGATQSATLTPSDDLSIEGDETVNLSIQNVSGPGDTGGIIAHVATITEDDVALVEFQAATSDTVDESTPLLVTLALSTSPAGATLAAGSTASVIDLMTGSATSGTDYTVFGTQTPAFPAGAGDGATATVMVTPNDDPTPEGPETVNLSITSASSLLTVGPQSSHGVTITDDDNGPPVANDDAGSTDEDTTVTVGGLPGAGVLLNDTDPNLDSLVVTSFDQVPSSGLTTAGGTLTTAAGALLTIEADGGYTYVPVGAFDALQVGDLATEVFTYTVDDGNGSTDTATLTISIDGVNDNPTATADPPVAHPTAEYETVGNTLLYVASAASGAPINVIGNLLGNDTDVDNLTAELFTTFTATTSALGGDVTIFDGPNNGDFLYNPPVGMSNVTDSFTYTVNDPNGGSATGTVNLRIVDELVYYVDNTSGAGGDGRSNSRFDSLTDVPQGGSGTIYVFEGAGSYPGSVTLGNSQRLYGAGFGLAFPSVNGGPVTLYAATSRPTLGGTTTLAQDNFVRGLDYDVSGVTSAIRGVNVGALLLADVAVTATNATATAIELENGVGMNAVFDSVSINGALGGIRLAGNTGVVAFGDATITGTTAAPAVRIMNNTATTTFATLSVDNLATGWTGLEASFSGLLTVNADDDNAGGAIDAGSGPGVDIDNTELDVALTSVSSSGGNVPAIDLNTTTGSLKVTGTGAPGSGGTIANKTGVNAAPPFEGAGIVIVDATNIELSSMALQDFSNWAIYGQGVDGFTMDGCSVTATTVNGDSALLDEGSVLFNGLTGTVLLNNSTISGGFLDNLRISNLVGSGTLNLGVLNCVFGLNGISAGRDSLYLETDASNSADLTVIGSTFLGARGDLLQTYATGSSNLTTNLTDNMFTNTHPGTAFLGGGVALGGDTTGALNLVVRGTTPGTQVFTGARGDALRIDYGGGATMGPALVENNQIGTSGVPGSGSREGSGIVASTRDSVTASVTIQNNTVVGIGTGADGFAGANLQARGASQLNATVTNNSFSEMGGLVFSALFCEAGQGVAGETAVLCADIQGNAFDASGSPFAFAHAIWNQYAATTTHNLPGYGGGPANDAALQAYLLGLGNTFGPALPPTDSTLTLNMTGAGATCP